MCYWSMVYFRVKKKKKFISIKAIYCLLRVICVSDRVLDAQTMSVNIILALLEFIFSEGVSGQGD